MIGLDTTVVVRLLVGEPVAQATRAREFLDELFEAGERAMVSEPQRARRAQRMKSQKLLVFISFGEPRRAQRMKSQKLLVVTSFGEPQRAQRAQRMKSQKSRNPLCLSPSLLCVPCVLCGR